VSGTGQALQGDSLPDPAGRVGGEGTGDSTGGGVFQVLGGLVGISWVYIIFSVFALKCLFLIAFNLKMAFLLFSIKESRSEQLYH
jgi:hypothetical protein